MNAAIRIRTLFTILQYRYSISISNCVFDKDQKSLKYIQFIFVYRRISLELPKC